MRGDDVNFTIDEFIIWILEQIAIDEGLTEEQEKRIHDRLFPAEEAADNGQG